VSFFSLPDWIASVNPAFLNEPNHVICIDAGDGFGLKLARSIQNEGETCFTNA
jgi:hypothetical protein